MLEAVMSLETFLFVEWHYADLADVPSFTPFLVSCLNMALSTRILLHAMSTLHNFLKGMFPEMTQKSHREVHMSPTWVRS
jgi:hypothetical protein